MTKEMVISMKDVREGDEVFCTDGKWRKVKRVLDIHKSDTLFEILTDKGTIKCSGDHLWNLFIAGEELKEIETFLLYNNRKLFCKLYQSTNKNIDGSCFLGVKTGPLLINVSLIENEMVRCIEVDDEGNENFDHQFEILATDENLNINTTKFNVIRN